jgi:hypothetical protein
MDIRRQNIDIPTSETCTWLSELPKYQEWLQRQHGFLWLKGKPGAGKSTLMRRAFEDVTKDSDNASIVTAGFFYSSRGVFLERSALGLFRSILHQIFWKNRALLPQFLTAYNEKTAKYHREWQWQLEELQELFSKLTSQGLSSRIIIFIDALDEGDEGEIRKMLSFFEAIMLSNESKDTKRLNICLSSRHYPTISLRDCPEIWVERYNKDDISTYVQRTLGTSSADPETKELIEIVLAKASGVFLWVVLAIELMVKSGDDGDTIAKRREKLQTVPAGLEALFTEILERVSPQERHETYQILKWVSYSRRRLQPIELLFALGVETDAPVHSFASWKESGHVVKDDQQMVRFLRSRSKGLVELKYHKQSVYGDPKDPETIWNRLHSSGNDDIIKAFKSPDRVMDFENLSVASLSNRSTKDDDKDSKSLLEVEILLASVQFIHEAVREFLVRKGLLILDPSLRGRISGRCNDYLAKSCFKYLGSPELHRLASNHFMSESQPRSQLESSTGLHLMSQVKLGKLPDTSEEESINMPLQGEGPIHPAYHPLQGELVFQYGVDDIRTEYPFLDYSVRMCFEHVREADSLGVQQDHVVDLLSGSNSDVFDCWHHFVKQFEPRTPVLEIDGRKPTLLEVLSAGSITSAIHSMLQRSGTREIQGLDRESSLRVGAAFGRIDVVQLMLQARAIPNAGNHLGMTALHLAAQKGFDGIVQLLLRSGAAIDSLSTFGWNALHWATEGGHTTTIQILLTADADVKSRNIDGETALAIAARRGEIETFKALLTAGADLNTTDNFGRTPLHLAASFGHEKIVALLLQCRPNLEAVTLQGYTAFHLALTSEIKGMIKDAGAVVPVESVSDRLMASVGSDVMDVPERSMTASPDPFYFSHRLNR